MELPRRIKDGGAGEWERVVISSAEIDAPSPEFRRSLAVKLGVAASAAGIAATTASSVKAVGSALWLKWMGVGFALGLVGIGAASYASRTTPVERAALGVSLVVLPVSAAPSAAARVAPASDFIDTVPSERDPDPEPVLARGSRVATAAPASAAPAVGPLGTASFTAPTQSDLAAQMAAIHRIRASLAAGLAPQALTELDQYEHAYPSGLFQLEARVLRIDSYAQLHDANSVQGLARRFLAQHPDSPYARHVQTELDQGGVR